MTSTVTTPPETAAPNIGRTGLPAVLARRRPTGVAVVATTASLTLLSATRTGAGLDQRLVRAARRGHLPDLGHRPR